MTRLVLCKNGMQKWYAKMFLHISQQLIIMKHENIYCKFYYEGCFHSSVKKSCFAKVSYCQNFNIGEVSVVSVYPANTQCFDNVVVRLTRRRTVHNVVATLMPQQQDYNVAPMLP